MKSKNHKNNNMLKVLVIFFGMLITTCGAPSITESIPLPMVEGNSDFAFDLYQEVRIEDGNLFFSPYSISTALAMTYAGARNDTEKQIADVFHFTLPQDELHKSFRLLDFSLTNPDQNNTNQSEGDFDLVVANSIWGQDGYPYQKRYINLIAKNYGAELRLVDFIDDNNREQARANINDWISEQTQEKIENLIQSGMLTPLTRLVLANAVYFKADWEAPFLGGTTDGEFYLLDGSSVTAPMMFRREDTNYSQGAGYQALEIAYKGERIRMIVLLPDEEQFELIESKFNYDFVNSVLRDFKSHDIQLYMPKFEYEATLSLSKKLSKMGMPDAFNPSLADFTGITDGRELYISEVAHKGYIAVNEKGTEAAAATGVFLGAEEVPLDIRVNRPFIFFIYDSDSGTIIFIGRLVNPRS